MLGSTAAMDLDCDLLGVSGGFNPVVHLASQAQLPLRFDVSRQCFVPEAVSPAISVVGAAAGNFDSSLSLWERRGG